MRVAPLPAQKSGHLITDHNSFSLFPSWMLPSYTEALCVVANMKGLSTVSCDQRSSSPQTKRFNRSDPRRKGDGHMKDPRHRIRHPRRHPGDRLGARKRRGCGWRDGQFGRGQNTGVGWSDPCSFLATCRWPKVASLQPTHRNRDCALHAQEKGSSNFVKQDVRQNRRGGTAGKHGNH